MRLNIIGRLYFEPIDKFNLNLGGTQIRVVRLWLSEMDILRIRGGVRNINKIPHALRAKVKREKKKYIDRKSRISLAFQKLHLIKKGEGIKLCEIIHRAGVMAELKNDKESLFYEPGRLEKIINIECKERKSRRFRV